jgi:hypothetical protein
MSTPERPARISLKTALFIAEALGPATATHYLLRDIDHGARDGALPAEFFELLAKLSAASEKREGESDSPSDPENPTRSPPRSSRLVKRRKVWIPEVSPDWG